QIFHTPFYPALIAFFLSFGETPRHGEALIGFQHFLGLCSCVLFYKIAQRTWSSTVALFTGLFLALDTLVLYYESVVQTETLFLFFLGLLLFYSLRILERGKLWEFPIIGFLAACLTLTRPVAQFFVVVLVIASMIATRNAPVRKRIVAGGLIAL